MRPRPLSIYIFSGILFLSGPFWLAYLSILSSGDFEKAAMKIDLGWFVLFAMGAFLGVGLWKLKRWAFAGTLVYVFGAIFLLHKEVFVNDSQPYETVFIGTLAAIGSLVCLLDERVLGLYFGSFREWFRRSPRFETRNTVQIYFQDKVVTGELMNLSETGCLAQIDDLKLSNGDKIIIKTNSDLASVELNAHVVRATPPGYGMLFIIKSREDQLKLSSALAALKPTFLPPPKKDIAAF